MPPYHRLLQPPQEDGMVTCAHLSSDGKHMASCTDQGTIGVWDMDRGQLLRSWLGHEEVDVSCCHAVVFMSPVGDMVVSAVLRRPMEEGEAMGKYEDPIKVWDADTGKLMHLLVQEDKPCICLSIRTPLQILSLNDQGVVNIWEAKTGRLLRTMDTNRQKMRCMALSHQGNVLACTGYTTPSQGPSADIQLWDIDSGMLVQTLLVPKDCIAQSVVWSPADDRLYATFRNGYYPQMWDVASGRSIPTPDVVATEPPQSLYSCAGGDIMVWYGCGEFYIIDRPTSRLIRSFCSESGGWSNGVDVSAAGDRIVACSRRRPVIEVWDVSTGELYSEQKLFCCGRGRRAAGYAVISRDCKFAVSVEERDPDEPSHSVRYGAVGDDKSQPVCVGWKEGSESLQDQDDDRYPPSMRDIACVCLSPGNDLLYCASFDGSTIDVCELPSGKWLRSIQVDSGGKDNRTSSISISPAGHLLSIVKNNQSIVILDTKTGAKVRTLVDDDHPMPNITVARFMPAGGSKRCRLASGDQGGNIKLWDAETGELLLSFHVETSGKGIYDFAFDPGKGKIAPIGENYHEPCDGSKLFDVANGTLCHDFGGADVCGGGVLCMDHPIVVYASSDHVYVWNTFKESYRLYNQFPNTAGNQLLTIQIGQGPSRLVAITLLSKIVVWEYFVDNFPSPTDVLQYVEDDDDDIYERVSGSDMCQCYFSKRGRAFELISYKGQNVNILLHLVDLALAEKYDFTWVFELLDADPMRDYPVFFKEILDVLAHDRCLFLTHHMVFVADRPPAPPRTLLSIALERRDYSVVQELIRRIDLAVHQLKTHMITEDGVPYYHVSDFQKAMMLYPRETIEAMNGLWNLTHTKHPPIRRRDSSRQIQASHYLTGVWEQEESSQQQASNQTIGWAWSLFLRNMLRWPLTNGKLQVYPAKSKSDSPAGATAVGSCSTAADQALSKKAYSSNNDLGVPMETLVVPLPGVCEMGPDSFIATCIHVSDMTSNISLFESSVVQTVLDYKWESYAKAMFLFSCAVSVLLAINFSTYSYYGEDLPLEKRGGWTACLIINLRPLLIQEIIQLPAMADNSGGCLPLQHWMSLWNVVDAVSFLGLVVVLVLRLTQPYAIYTYIMSATVSLLLWLKLLYFFRGFQSTGALIRTILTITADIRFFLVILLVFILAFGNAFFLLSRIDLRSHANDYEALDGAFGTYVSTFLSLFSAMTGNYDLALFEGSTMSPLATVLYLLYIVAQAIIMLNLLIAIMGDSYDNVQQRVMGAWRCEQAKIILEQEQVLRWLVSPAVLDRWRMPWLHVLREAGNESGTGEEEWAGRVKAVTREVSAVRNVIQEVKDSHMQDMKDIKEDMRHMKSELDELKSLMGKMIMELRKSKVE